MLSLQNVDVSVNLPASMELTKSRGNVMEKVREIVNLNLGLLHQSSEDCFGSSVELEY